MLSVPSHWGRHRCAIIMALAAAVLLPQLGSFGLWEPFELDILDGSIDASKPLGDAVSRWAVQRAVHFGEPTAWWARIASVCFGGTTLALTFAWVSRATKPRSAAIATLLLLSAPLFLLQSRQAVSTLPTVAANLLILIGTSEFLFASKRSRYAGAALAAVGTTIGCLASGWLFGVFVPGAAVAIAACAQRRWRLAGAIAGALALSLALLPDAWPAMAARWHPIGRFDSWTIAFEHVAFGAFPWVVVVPFALLQGSSVKTGRRHFASRLAASWVLLSLLVGTVHSWHMAPAIFLALPGLAYLAANWMTHEEHKPHPQLHQSLLLAMMALMLGQDLRAFSDKLPALHLPTESLQHGAASRTMTLLFILTAIAFGVALVLRHLRWAPLVTMLLTVSLVSGGLFSHLWMPSLSKSLSQDALISNYLTLRKSSEPIATIGPPPRLLQWRVPQAQSVSKRELLRSLERPGRVFALLQRNAFCPLRQFARLQNSDLLGLAANATHVLASNQVHKAEPRALRLEDYILAADQAGPPTSSMQVFNETLVLRKVSMPKRVRADSSFDLTLHFEVLKRPRRSWKVFAHFDGPGARFQADHWPIENLCQSNHWNAGDVIVDTVRATAGSRKGTHKLWVGFFYGSHGSWTRMPVSSGAHEDDRVLAGTLDVY